MCETYCIRHKQQHQMDVRLERIKKKVEKLGFWFNSDITKLQPTAGISSFLSAGDYLDKSMNSSVCSVSVKHSRTVSWTKHNITPSNCSFFLIKSTVALRVKTHEAFRKYNMSGFVKYSCVFWDVVVVCWPSGPPYQGPEMQKNITSLKQQMLTSRMLLSEMFGTFVSGTTVVINQSVRLLLTKFLLIVRALNIVFFKTLKSNCRLKSVKT